MARGASSTGKGVRLAAPDRQARVGVQEWVWSGAPVFFFSVLFLFFSSCGCSFFFCGCSFSFLFLSFQSIEKVRKSKEK